MNDYLESFILSDVGVVTLNFALSAWRMVESVSHESICVVCTCI